MSQHTSHWFYTKPEADAFVANLPAGTLYTMPEFVSGHGVIRDVWTICYGTEDGMALFGITNYQIRGGAAVDGAAAEAEAARDRTETRDRRMAELQDRVDACLDQHDAANGR